MHVEYRISERDYRGAATLAARKRSTRSLVDYYIPYIFALIWILIGIVPNPVNHYLEQPVDLVFTLGVLPIALGFMWLRRGRFNQDYRRLRNFHLLQELDLDANGLRLATSLGTSRSSWDLYSRFAEDSRSFILFLKQDEHGFLPITKEHLSVLQIDELRALLKSRLPSA